MTNREFFTAVIALAEHTEDKTITFGNIHATADDIIASATDAIAKLDKRNASRSSKPSKTAIANEPIKAAICKAIHGKRDVIASDIVTALGGDISVNKVSALCRQMCDAGLMTSTDVKVPKKGKVKGYTLVTAEGEDE